MQARIGVTDKFKSDVVARTPDDATRRSAWGIAFEQQYKFGRYYVHVR
jgi:hypothetical protein